MTLADSFEDATVVEPGVHPFVPPASGDTGFLAVDRTIANSTIWLGEFLVNPEPTEANYFVMPSTTDRSASCGTGWYVDADYNRHEFLAGGGSGSKSCRKGNRVTFVHQGPSQGDLSEAEGNVVAWEEPPVSDVTLLPPPAMRSKWSGKAPAAQGSAELGSDFASAPELVDGRWDVHIDPGRTALFKVPLDWYQHMQVQLTYDGARTKKSVPISPVLINPIGAQSYWGQAVDSKKGEVPPLSALNLAYSDSEGAGVVSPSITWRNREENGVTAAFPGDYYVLLQMPETNASDEKLPAAGVDITVAVKVVTDKPARSPYSQDPDPIPSLSGEDEQATDETQRASDSDTASESTPWVAVGGLFGGSVVMAAAGFVALGKHRRSHA